MPLTVQGRTLRPTLAEMQAVNLKALFSVYAVITAIFGVALLVVPSRLLAIYGAPPLDTLETILSRFIGAALLGLVTMAWAARDAAASPARDALILGLTVANGLGAVVAVLGARSGVFNWLAWTEVGLLGLFTVLFIVAASGAMSRPAAG